MCCCVHTLCWCIVDTRERACKMPVHCQIAFPRLSTSEFGRLDYQCMAHAFECHSTLGRLADEPVYQSDLAARLQQAGHFVRTRLPVEVVFGNFSKSYYLDLIIDELAVYELKAVSQIATEHIGQLMNYLFLLDCSRGKIINFRPASVQSVFVNTPLSSAERRSFAVHDSQWSGDNRIRDWIVEFLRDLGTALELTLYQQALVHFLGGEEFVSRLMPMGREGIQLGNQHFQMMEPDIAFRITTLQDGCPNYESNLRRLLIHSTLKAIHWINIAYHDVSFNTVRQEN